MALVLSEAVALLPDIYDKLSTSNIYKIMQVFIEELNKLSTVFDDIEGLEDINNVFGATLDLLGADYGLDRGGKSDEDFRALILAKQNNFVDGNTIDSIINYFSYFVPLADIFITERYISSLGLKLDGTWKLDGTEKLRGGGTRRPRSFDVTTSAISASLEASLLEAVQLLKGGGIEATVNSL